MNIRKNSDQDAFSYIKRLIEIPSPSSKEEEAATFLEKSLPETLSGQIKRSGNNIIVTLGDASAAHRLLLCSHIDTVEAADTWTRDPWKADSVNGKIYGLGANDALASVVSMIFAASRMQDRISGNAGITLALVAEEEKGENGFCGIEPDLSYTSAIFGEPTDLRIGTAMRGYMRLTLKAQGTACHASRPWEGRNAIKDLAHAIEKISALNLKDRSPWGMATIEPTIISGGKSTNQIPDRAEAVLDIRPTADINNEQILDMLKQVGCAFDVLHNRRKPMACSTESEIFQTIIQAHPQVEIYAFGGTCDMAFATKPSVVAGPGKSVRSHSADEYIEEHELSAAIEFYERILNTYISKYA